MIPIRVPRKINLFKKIILTLIITHIWMELFKLDCSMIRLMKKQHLYQSDWSLVDSKNGILNQLEF